MGMDGKKAKGIDGVAQGRLFCQSESKRRTFWSNE